MIEGTEATLHEDTIGDMNAAAFSGAGPGEITEIGLYPYVLAFANNTDAD